MICVSSGNIDLRKLNKLLKSEDLVEIRLDLNDFTDNELLQIFSSSTKTIATCRPGKLTEEERVRKLKLCIRSGASFVDFELESMSNSFNQIFETAKEHNCRLIVSHHNHEKTPESAQLKQIFRSCSETGADIIKIATYVNDTSDNSKILSLYSLKEYFTVSTVIAIGMGKLGRITRIAAPFLGAPFTYASSETGKETAKGQIEKHDLEKIFKIIENE